VSPEAPGRPAPHLGIRAAARTVLDRARGTLAGRRLAAGVFAPPREVSTRTPADVGLDYETWSWRTRRDGVPIAAWYVPGRGPGAVLISHGMGRSKASVLAHARLLHDAGYSVLAADSRNHGESGSSRRRRALADRFSADLQDAVDQLRADERTRGGVAVLAFSFACWPALRGARRDRLPVDAVVCDSGPVIAMVDAVTRLVRLQARLLPAWAHDGAGLDAVLRSARWFFARSLRESAWPPTDPGVPVLLVAGGRDRILPAAEVAALGAVVPGTTTVVVPRATHLRAIDADPDAYADAVLGFLATALADVPGGAPVRAGDPAGAPPRGVVVDG